MENIENKNFKKKYRIKFLLCNDFIFRKYRNEK